MILKIRDETASGSVTNELTLDLLDESVTVRELIRSRVYQEVEDYNRKTRAPNLGAPVFNGLVTPTEMERRLNPDPAPRSAAKEVDWKMQFEVACDAFERNRFFILVDDLQAENLDDTILLKAHSTISFVKLTPLVGG